MCIATQPTARSGPQSDQRGSVLVVVMILFVGFAAFASASLAKVLAEDRKVSQRLSALQAETMANSQLELAKNIVNASAYDHDFQNEVLKAALLEPNQVIPGTAVRAEQIGTTPYFRLATAASQRGVERVAEAVVRQSSPASQYNLFVIDHPVGLCGAPRGAIHTNRNIDFYFPGGVYQDTVTASEGFEFTAGATQFNTTFAGVTNQAAPAYDILASVDFSTLSGRADVLAVTDPDLIAEVEFQGDQTQVKLYRPGHYVDEERTRMVSVFSHNEVQEYIESEPIYETETYTVTETVYGPEEYIEVSTVPVYAWRDATRTVTENVYEDQTVGYTVDVPTYATRTSTRQVWRDIWVPYDSSEGTSTGGGTVGATGSAAGYWRRTLVDEEFQETYISGWTTESRTRTERVVVGTTTREETYSEQYVERFDSISTTRTRQIPIGTQEVTRTRQIVVGWEDVPKTRTIAIYNDVPETYTVPVWVDEVLERTETVSSNGVLFLRGSVRGMSGVLNGRLSMITGGSASITGHIQYVDDDGDTRMLNGTNKEEPYVENPDYQGSSLLALMARDDIRYAKECPPQLEINASLISARGVVSFEGIEVSDDGSQVSSWLGDDPTYVKESIRRLGGIVSRKRPVATYIDERGYISAGFENGESIMDQNLILSSGNNAPPPFMFEAAIPTWILSVTGQHLQVTN